MVEMAKIRNVPGWEDCPVPVCHGGDPRALTFCCRPGYMLTFSNICQRDEMLDVVGLSQKEFVEIKDKFSTDVGWDDERVCFGSLSYCCLRKSGCPSWRDYILKELYGQDFKKAFSEYMLRKRVLAVKLLEKGKNKDSLKEYIDNEREKLRKLGRSDILYLLEKPY